MPSERQLLSEIEKHAKALAGAAAAAEFWRGKTLEAIDGEHQRRLAEIEAEHSRSMAAAAQAYDQSLSQAQAGLAALEPKYGLAELGWDAPQWVKFMPLTETSIPRLTRVGWLTAQGTYGRIEMPMLMPIIGSRNLLIKASGSGKETARAAMQSVMLRLLATLPPGKLRFVCIDPVGLGSSMAGFIKELPEFLTGGQARFDSALIEQSLADLETHMATVNQKYLGVRYATMEEYNAQAGEVAEPYRLLVVADFPARFSDSAAQRLVSIATNGRGTGVYVLAMVDTEQKLPYNFNLGDLERKAEIVVCDGSRAAWQDPDFKGCSLSLDRIPSADQFERIVKSVGEAAVAASEVKVPIEKAALPPEKWWQGDARNGVRVPIGRVGAEGVHMLEFHEQKMLNSALVIGQPRSGKSTLLHGLLTNLSQTYSPDEVELYLIDFKQVEFNDYATYALPHARVVAVHSEREFCLSVLRRLSAELQRRSDLLRQKGFVSLSEYRNRTGERLPRILLIMDEFQEMFSPDDNLAQEAGLILDRLVRIAPAFGINVLLSSQTLSGNYTLSRATKDQIPIRIALAAADADSRAVLSDENDRARLLERPGEAIYNAANGRIEGNSLFQGFWLSPDRREVFLGQMADYATRRGYTPPEPPIVFNGDAPAAINANRDLDRLLAAPDWPAPPKSVAAWLGEPIEIKPHTAALFRRQSGSNLLIVGQNEYAETATAMLLTALLSLAAQHRPTDARFILLNLTDVDSEWHDLPNALAEAAPHTMKVVERRGVLAAIDEVSAELARRSADEEETRERVNHWQRETERGRREVARAEAALGRCEASGYVDEDGRYYPPDCRAEARGLANAVAKLKECEENLQTAKAWRSRVEQAVSEYQREARRLAEVAGRHTEKARAHLRQTAAKYEEVKAAASGVGAVGAVVAAGVFGIAAQAASSPQGITWAEKQAILKEDRCWSDYHER